MHTKIVSVAKQLPRYSKETNEIIPYVKNWMSGQDNRFKRKVLKLFKGVVLKEDIQLWILRRSLQNHHLKKRTIFIYMKQQTLPSNL